MSLTTACLLTLLRTIVLCLFAWPIAVSIERWMRSLGDRWRSLAFAVLLAPFLFPELLVGYTFRDAALSSPQRAEWLCAGLLFVRIVPVGVVTLLASPAALVSAAAIHCRTIVWQANRQSLGAWWHLLACYWYGPFQRAWPALGLMSVIAFQEFELAALLQAASWTDWFIAAQRMALDRQQMARQAVWPILMQLPLLVAAIRWLTHQNPTQSDPHEEISVPTPSYVHGLVPLYLALALTVGCLIPLCGMGWSLNSGLKLLASHPMQWTGLGREALIAGAASLCAGWTAWFVSRRLLEISRTNYAALGVCWIVLIPGLAGSLLLSLAIVALFQQTWLRPLYDTPLPWVLALSVWLLPRAILLRLWIRKLTRTEAVHLAEIALGSIKSNPSTGASLKAATSISRSRFRTAGLLFRLRDQPQWLAIGLLCYWAYVDLSSAYLLAPSGMSSGLVRLYDFMHYGRSAPLSAESLLFFGLPLFVMFLVLRIGRIVLSRGH